MKFIGQYIQSFIARFRSDVYLEDVDAGTVVSGGNLGLDSSNKIVKGAAPLGTLTTLTVDEITIDGDTITASDDLNIVADGNDITIDTDTFTIESATTSRPFFKLKGVGNNANPSQMWIIKDKGAAGADGDEIGRIYFVGDDTVQTQTGYGEIKCTIGEANNNNEAGKLELRVANDGDLRNVITGTGIAATAAEVDVTIANGAASVTTVAGTLTMGSTAAMTNAGLLSVANQTGITGVGTISSGTWQGTAIATDYLKHKSTFELAGYAVADGTNYMMADIMSGNKAPFLHDETSIGANGTTADNPAAFLRAAGTVMPYNGTLKIWKGWGASNGTPTVDIGIFKYSPTADDATSDSLVLVKNTQITGAGNDNLKAFSETSFSVTVTAGDILITAIKGSVNAKTAYFTSTVEIEWTS